MHDDRKNEWSLRSKQDSVGNSRNKTEKGN